MAGFYDSSLATASRLLQDAKPVNPFAGLSSSLASIAERGRQAKEQEYIDKQRNIKEAERLAENLGFQYSGDTPVPESAFANVAENLRGDVTGMLPKYQRKAFGEELGIKAKQQGLKTGALQQDLARLNLDETQRKIEKRKQPITPAYAQIAKAYGMPVDENTTIGDFMDNYKAYGDAKTLEKQIANYDRQAKYYDKQTALIDAEGKKSEMANTFNSTMYSTEDPVVRVNAFKSFKVNNPNSQLVKQVETGAKREASFDKNFILTILQDARPFMKKIEKGQTLSKDEINKYLPMMQEIQEYQKRVRNPDMYTQRYLERTYGGGLVGSEIGQQDKMSLSELDNMDIEQYLNFRNQDATQPVSKNNTRNQNAPRPTLQEELADIRKKINAPR